jgi:hypothetical protein
MCNCGDYEPPEFAWDRNVKAKKRHRCGECLRAIEPGETYQKCCGKWDGEFNTYKTCLGCIDLAKRSGVECWCFGRLMDDFHWADRTPEIDEWLAGRERRRLELEAIRKQRRLVAVEGGAE